MNLLVAKGIVFFTIVAADGKLTDEESERMNRFLLNSSPEDAVAPLIAVREGSRLTQEIGIAKALEAAVRCLTASLSRQEKVDFVRECLWVAEEGGIHPNEVEIMGVMILEWNISQSDF
jgi:hypothetical protein